MIYKSNFGPSEGNILTSNNSQNGDEGVSYQVVAEIKSKIVFSFFFSIISASVGFLGENTSQTRVPDQPLTYLFVGVRVCA